MQYSRLIRSLVDECVAANLGGYDVEDVVASRATDGDLIREVLVKGVCDPRFKSRVRATKLWEKNATSLLEEFAQELMDTPGLGRDEALERLDEFLVHYFLTMVDQVRPDRPGGKPRAGESAGGEGAEGGDEDEAQEAQNLGQALQEMDAGPEEERERMVYEAIPKSDGDALSREDEQRVELRFLRSIPPSLRRLARLIGRSANEETASSGRFLTASKSDIAGITVGDNLGSLLPSEVALLAGRETEDVFFRNFVGKRLQVFASASAGGKNPVARQDGPVVVCLDRSSSMEGRPSDVARALTMAVTILAKRRGREVVVVKYGNGSEEHFLVKNLRKQRKAFIRFLSYRCAGGNNEDSMFGMVFRDLIPREKDFTSADVLCVSDFGWSPVSAPVMERIRESKAKGMKFYGLDVTGEGIRDFDAGVWYDGSAGAFPPQIVDSMWLWDDDRNLCFEESPQKGGKLPPHMEKTRGNGVFSKEKRNRK